MDKGEFFHQDKKSASRKRRNRKKRRHEKQAAISGFKDAYQNLKNEETQQQNYVKSERIQEAEAESEKIRNTIKSETEAFVANIPFNFYAKDLVEFFANKLKSMGVHSKRSVVQCVIIEKRGRHAGCASVIFESPDHMTALQRVASTLMVGNPPRLLRIKEGDNRQLQRRYNSMHRAAEQSRSLALSAKALELCVNLPVAAQQQEDVTTTTSPAHVTDILWGTTEKSDSNFKLSINTSKKCITSMFRIIPDGSEQQPKDGKDSNPYNAIFQLLELKKSDLYMLQISLKKIRNVLLGRDSTNGNIILTFEIKHPPRLYRHVPKNPFERTLFGRGVVSSFVWRLGPGGDAAVQTGLDVDEEDDYIRTTDPTSVNAFGRALWYRFVFGKLQENALNDLVRKLQEFALLNSREAIDLTIFGPVTLFPHSPIAVSIGQSNHLLLHEVWMALQSCQVHLSTMYLLHCLHGANKMDLLTWLRSRDFRQSVRLFKEGISVHRLNSILENCFYDSTLYFIQELSTCIIRRNSVVDDTGSYETSAGEKAEAVTMQKTSAFLESEDDDGMDDSDSIEDDDSLDVLLVGRVVVTPTRICPQPAVREQSNRVIREFSRFKERFVRITFVDDNFGSILGAKSEDIFNLRILKIMQSGFVVAGRKFVFLAFSNSQIRDQSCWFYDETSLPGEEAAPTASFIRNWIGDLSSIKIIGKYAARLGQGFSTTLPVAKFSQTQICDVPDVKRNGFCFSDGVGMISMTCAQRASKDMGLRYTPSAFQVRYGGAKGMLTVMPDEFLNRNSNHRPCEIAFRDSMRKFPSEHNQLEINSYAKPMPCFLNRQLITLLSTRGIRDRVFLDLLHDMIGDFDAALRDNESAQLLVQRHSGFDFVFHSQSVWAGVWHLLNIGVPVAKDLYVSGLIIAIRNSLLLELQTKARIFVKKGVCLIGVMDETNTLKPGEIFMQISAKKFGEPPRMFEDGCTVLVGRNPSLHPGDLRKLRVRNLPALGHLVDVIVFPSLGERPHADEMSGGDLDGDIYFAIWDSNLIPQGDFPPMEYSGGGPAVPPQSSLSTDGVTHTELVHFFVNYIRNDNLGVIANAHLVFADLSCEKAASKECIHLAKLHSTAVDFVKSGIPAVMERELKVKQYPSFLEKQFQISYESPNILGQIYTIAMKKKTSSYNMMGGVRLKVEERFLIEGFQAYLEDAIDNMSDYNNRLWRIMQRYGVLDEMEILSGHVRNFSRKVCPKGGKGKDEVLKRLARDIKVLRKYFWDVFWEEFSTTNEEQDGEDGDAGRKGGPHYYYPVEVRKKAAAWYFETYNQEVFDYPPLVSFPWIVAG
eukprot:gene34994-45294_t